MRVSGKSVIQLHPLYHRREGEQYVVGNPETGEFMYVTPAELHVLQLLYAKLAFGQIEELLHREQIPVRLRAFIGELREKGFVHRVDGKVLSAAHEPLHEFRLPVRWLGTATARFVYLLLSMIGVFTLFFYGRFPSFYTFFFTESMFLVALTILAAGWLLLFVRQLVKYAACSALGVPAKFGFANSFHAFVPKVYHAHVSDEQEHAITGTSLLGLTAITSIALLGAVHIDYPHNVLWQLFFAVGVLEILAECLLFMGTDLARFIALTANAHKLNKRTADALKQDISNLFNGKPSESHPTISRYAFFYMLSMVLAVLLLFAYVIPALLYFLMEALAHLTRGDALYYDSVLALAFLGVNLLLYGFALLRHHPLSHNTLFVDASIVAIVLGSSVIAVLGTELFTAIADPMLGSMLLFSLGILLAVLFEYAVLLARPFADEHNIFESVLLPVAAASIPLVVLFALPGLLYGAALTIAVGMLAAVGISHFSRKHPV